MNARLKRLAAAPALAFALAGAPPALAAGPELIEALRANGAQVVALGSRGGLEGYFVTPAKAGGYSLYVTGDGHAVAGLLYGPDGREVTGAQLAAVHSGGVAESAAGTFAREADPTAPEIGADGRGTTGAVVTAHATAEFSAPPSSPASLAALLERSAAAFGFTLGHRGPVVVLLGDAACPWSRSAAAKLGREALDGRLQLRVVPVAILGAAAARQAAAIAAHPDPASAWFEGPERPADRAGAERIARNNALLDEWGAGAVPLIAWRASDGRVAHRVGDIDDPGAWLKETFGPQTLVPETFVPYTLGVGDQP